MSALALLWLVVALPFVGSLANGVIAVAAPARRTWAALIGPGVVLAAFGLAALAVAEFAARPDGTPYVVTLWPWLEAERLHVDLALQLDRLSAVLLLVVTGVGSLIHLFSVAYMREDEGFARYFAYLNLFVGMMLVLVLGASYPVLFVGWEGVGLCSYLLIGFWYAEPANATAGKKAFLVNRVGDVGFLIAMFLLYRAFGALDFRTIDATAAQALGMRGEVATLIALMLALACAGKSAQVPLYVWLPDAMAGPTPVSALIHAATMVTAGVYLVARAAPIFALAPIAQAVVALAGAATALLGAVIALRQHDIKKVLAFSTVSQLGYMFVGVGSGAYEAGLFHLVTHAFFKALLFLGAGSVIHAMHGAYHATHADKDPQDLRNMGGLAGRMPWTSALMVLAVLAIAGVPPLAGFWSKDAILAGAYARAVGTGGTPFGLAFAVALVAALLTAIYMARLVALAFFGTTRLSGPEAEALHEAPLLMTGPLALLGLLTLVGGVLDLPEWTGAGGLLTQWLEPALATARGIAPVETVPHGAEAWIIGLAIVAGLTGLWLGWRGVLAAPVADASQATPAIGIARALERKLYVDELYDALVVRPYGVLARRVLFRGFERGVVDDGMVRGVARLARGMGWVGSRLQTGQIGVYVLMFVLGVVAILSVVGRR